MVRPPDLGKEHWCTLCVLLVYIACVVVVVVVTVPDCLHRFILFPNGFTDLTDLCERDNFWGIIQQKLDFILLNGTDCLLGKVSH